MQFTLRNTCEASLPHRILCQTSKFQPLRNRPSSHTFRNTNDPRYYASNPGSIEVGAGECWLYHGRRDGEVSKIRRMGTRTIMSHLPPTRAIGKIPPNFDFSILFSPPSGYPCDSGVLSNPRRARVHRPISTHPDSLAQGENLSTQPARIERRKKSRTQANIQRLPIFIQFQRASSRGQRSKISFSYYGQTTIMAKCGIRV